jgi:protein-tyrosine phosphatase
MIDFHTHILPGIDDGSKDTDMTEQMLRLAAFVR